MKAVAVFVVLATHYIRTADFIVSDMAEQIKMFIPKCKECEDSGIAYMWSRSLGPGLKYTIPIYCDCQLGEKMRIANKSFKKDAAKNRRTS